MLLNWKTNRIQSLCLKSQDKLHSYLLWGGYVNGRGVPTYLGGAVEDPLRDVVIYEC